eukprot:5928155-Amphidinium_carterae.2
MRQVDHGLQSRHWRKVSCFATLNCYKGSLSQHRFSRRCSGHSVPVTLGHFGSLGHFSLPCSCLTASEDQSTTIQRNKRTVDWHNIASSRYPLSPTTRSCSLGTNHELEPLHERGQQTRLKHKEYLLHLWEVSSEIPANELNTEVLSAQRRKEACMEYAHCILQTTQKSMQIL